MYRRHALAPFAAALLLVTYDAKGDPVDEGAPSGMVAFFSGGTCPVGWSVASSAQGRLVVGTNDGSKVGVQVGSPLGDKEDRQHQHAFKGSVIVVAKNIAAADGSNMQGASAQTYAVNGTTNNATSGAPFVQMQACVKP